MLEKNKKAKNLHKDNTGQQLYTHKFDNLGNLDHFLKKHKPVQFTQY